MSWKRAPGVTASSIAHSLFAGAVKVSLFKDFQPISSVATEDQRVDIAFRLISPVLDDHKVTPFRGGGYISLAFQVGRRPTSDR
jgi:hypothetical protein